MKARHLPVIAIVAFGAILFAFFYERGPSIVKRFEIGPLARSAWDYAGSRGPVLTIIHGNPFVADDERFRRAVLDELGRTPSVRVTAYTTDPGLAFQPSTRLILAFDTAPNTDGNKLCAGEVPPPAPGEALTMLMVLCSDSRLLSEVGGRMARGEGADDPRFRQLIDLSFRMLIDA